MKQHTSSARSCANPGERVWLKTYASQARTINKRLGQPAGRVDERMRKIVGASSWCLSVKNNLSGGNAA